MKKTSLTRGLSFAPVSRVELPSIAPAILMIIAGAILLPHASKAAPWTDVTEQAGLGGHQVSRLKFADLDGDRRPDAILLPDVAREATPRVFMNRAVSAKTNLGFEFIEVETTGLPPLAAADVLVFADLDSDGIQDAIVGRYLDIYQDDYAPPGAGPSRTSWLRGRGDGSFLDPMAVDTATPATTRAIAVNDVNEDGLLDLFIGNWYERYFTGYEAFPNDLLLQYRSPEGVLRFARWPIPKETLPTDYHDDLGGRPTYGTAMPRLDNGLPMLLELNYGRRWNRLYQLDTRKRLREVADTPAYPFALREPQAIAGHLVRQLTGRNIAAAALIDGDAIRHGRHPAWPQHLERETPRAQRPDEPPFRANGNTFDAAVGDIDNDGDFDLFLTTIIHAWAGESSDRSRFLVNQLQETGELKFYSFESLSADRMPQLPDPGEPLQLFHALQNQGDIYAELADLNHDGRLDLILCSSDYADEPPYEERLRIYFQQEDGRFKDVTQELEIDHVGAGMPSLADVNQDGALDLLIGQSFNRLPPERRRQAAIASGALSPENPADATAERRARLFLNTSTEGRASITLKLEGDPERSVSSDALGAVARLTANIDGDSNTPEVTQSRQLLGPAGHAGKQHEFILHFGLGKARHASRIEIQWPNAERTMTVLENLPAGRYSLRFGEEKAQAL